MPYFTLIFLLLLMGDQLTPSAWAYNVPLQTGASSAALTRYNDTRGWDRPAAVKGRDDSVVTSMDTIYLNGIPTATRTANSGYDITVDLQNGLWGFCPTSVIAATDCGLAGSCVDSHSCSDGCGFTGLDLTTFTWYEDFYI